MVVFGVGEWVGKWGKWVLRGRRSVGEVATGLWGVDGMGGCGGWWEAGGGWDRDGMGMGNAEQMDIG